MNIMNATGISPKPNHIMAKGSQANGEICLMKFMVGKNRLFSHRKWCRKYPIIIPQSQAIIATIVTRRKDTDISTINSLKENFISIKSEIFNPSEIDKIRKNIITKEFPKMLLFFKVNIFRFYRPIKIAKFQHFFYCTNFKIFTIFVQTHYVFGVKQ